MESNNKNYNRRNTTLQKYNKDHLSTTLRKREPTQPQSIDKDLTNELRKLRKLKVNPSKAKILRNTINITHLAKD